MAGPHRPVLASVAVATALVAACCWLDWTAEPAAVPTAPTAGPGAAVSAPAPPVPHTGDAGVTQAVDAPHERTIVVRVLDEDDGHVLAGARVTARVGGDETPSDTRADADAEGVARVTVAAMDDSLELSAEAKGHVRSRMQPDAEQLAAPAIEVRLGRAGRVRGVVRSVDGSPVAGATISVHADDGGDWTRHAVATTGADGAFDIDGIEPDEAFSLAAEGPDDGRIASCRDLLVEAAGDAVTADLVLAAPARLRVRVLWPDGLPLGGADAEVQPADAPAGPTDEAGTFTFAKLPAGHRRIVVQRWGFDEASAEVDLAAGESRTVDLRPAPILVLEGIVVDDTGIRVAGARLCLDGDGPRDIRSLGDGTFRIACPDDTPHELTVVHEGHSDATLAGVAAPQDGLRIELVRCAKVRCRLVLPGGVTATGPVAAWSGETNAASTLDHGVLTIDASAGSGPVSFQFPGFVVVARDVDASPGDVVDWGDVVLVAAPKLTGRVVDADGHPVDAFIYPKVGSALVPLTSTDKDGGFEFDGLPAGDAELRVEAAGFVQRTVHYAFAADAKPVVVVLARGGAVRGIVVDADGDPAPRVVYVSFADQSDPDDRDRMAFPNVKADGRFEVHLAPGRYKAATSSDDRTGTADVVVVDGETVEVTIRLER